MNMTIAIADEKLYNNIHKLRCT